MTTTKTEYRQLNPVELMFLAKELEQYPIWYTCVQFIKQYWPDTVYRFAIEPGDEGEYDDEGTTYYRVSRLTVFDESDNEVPIDRTSPLIAKLFPDGVEEMEDSEIFDSIKEFWMWPWRKDEVLKQYNLPNDFVAWNNIPRSSEYDDLNVAYLFGSYNNLYPVFVENK